MNTIKSQSIEHSIKENFKAYPFDYPLSGDGPSEEAISNLVNWVENEYDNDETIEKGVDDFYSIQDWYEIAIKAYLSYFSEHFGEEEETDENYNWIKEQVDWCKRSQ